MMYNLHKSTRKRHLFHRVHPTVVETSAPRENIPGRGKLVHDSCNLGTPLVTLDNNPRRDRVRSLAEQLARRNMEVDGIDRGEKKRDACRRSSGRFSSIFTFLRR